MATAASPTAATAKDAANPRLDEPKETAWSHIGLAESKTKNHGQKNRWKQLGAILALLIINANSNGNIIDEDHQ